MPGQREQLPPRIELRRVHAVDRYQIKRLWERRVGLSIEKTMDSVLDDESAAHCLVATEVESVVGFGVFSVFPADGLREVHPEYDGPLVGETNAVLSHACVDESWEGRGIGSELMRLRLAVARDVYDPSAAFGTAWVRSDAPDSSALFEKHGFRRLGTIENLYEEQFDGSDCPDCAPESCTCDGAVYGKPVA